MRIIGRKDYTLQGDPDALLEPPAGVTEARLIRIDFSEGVTLADLVLNGKDVAGAIGISESRGVRILRSTVEDASGGIGIGIHSSVSIVGSAIRRCQFHGIRVVATGTATVTGHLPPGGQPGTPTVIENNDFTGITLNQGDVLIQGGVVIRGNPVGVLGEGATIKASGGEAGLEISDNGTGISLRGGHLELRAPAVIEGNQSVGVRLIGASGSFSRFANPGQRVAVRNNGTAGDPASAGIFLTASQLDLVRTDVSGNAGRGILLQDNSSVRLFLTSVTVNAAGGLRLEALSTARLLDPTRLENNRGFDLSCTPNSYASGESAGVKRMNCPGFDRSPAPAPGGPDLP